MSYPHQIIEKKWQDFWKKHSCFQSKKQGDGPKFYALDMFPYPSGKGLHVGHLASYTPTDIVARYKRARGFHVLHPMGWDSFGLPSEQYAIQTNIHPEKITKEAIENFKTTLKSFGYSFDWEKEVCTSLPDYYKWTQFIFSKLFEKNLVYQKEVPVNWCPHLKTVLANEEVIDGKSERGGHPVVQVPMKQWMIKITNYAERLIQDLEKVDWPESTKQRQINWIGKSEGALIDFPIENKKEILKVFTTRPDTIYGTTFIVLAPEHPVVSSLTTEKTESLVLAYKKETSKKSEVQRKASEEKTGVFSGSFAIHPLTKEKIPIWVSDYVIMSYGTGAIMSVPGHDLRDFEFANKFDLPILRVIESKEDLPFEGDGKHINSPVIDGCKNKESIQKMVEFLEKNKIGKKDIRYKLRDWLFSRQRYWGEPIPLIHDEEGNVKTVPEDDLPVLLPNLSDYKPSEDGSAPLSKSENFINYLHPKNKKNYRRETHTMPSSAASSWYFLRYTDAKNTSKPFGFEEQKYWMPVDLYVGGQEHTVGHLLYARFFQKFLYDIGMVSHDEPFQKLRHQGTVMGSDGQRMSKSRGNIVNTDLVKKEYGADVVRLYITFLGPFDKDKPWNDEGIEGMKRFLNKLWSLKDEVKEIENPPEQLVKTYHKTIKKVTQDIENMSLNTAISAIMTLVKEMYKENCKPSFMVKTISQLLMPFAPHISEEIWETLGGKSPVSLTPWPEFDELKTADDVLQIGIQVNGKLRGALDTTEESTEESVLEDAKKITAVKNAIAGKKIIKIVYKQGKIFNIIVK